MKSLLFFIFSRITISNTSCLDYLTFNIPFYMIIILSYICLARFFKSQVVLVIDFSHHKQTTSSFIFPIEFRSSPTVSCF